MGPANRGSVVFSGLHHSFDEAGVQVNYEHSQESHLLARVLEYDARVVGLAPEAVGGHDHSQVVHVHFGNSDVGWLSKHLEESQRNTA